MRDYLNWRYATQKFDPLKKISKKNLSELLEVLRLAPSSYGLQPWKFVIVKDQALRKELRKFAWDQAQITEASDLVVFCSLKQMDANHIKKIVSQTAQARSVSVESLVRFEQVLVDFLQSQSLQEMTVWMKKQVYIALGMFLSACAQKRIDACPMEGFVSQEVDKVLGFEKLGIESTVLCPIGYRAKDDRYARLKKARLGKNEVIIEK
jgi:nitroreductase/dihydropteridine reductase